MTSPWTAPGSTDGSDDALSGQDQTGQGPAGQRPTGPTPTDRPWPAPGPSQPAPPPPGPASGRSRELVVRAPLFPLRPLSLGELLSAAARIYRLRPRAVFLVSGVVTVIAFALSTVLSGTSMLPFFASLDATMTTTPAGDDPVVSTSDVTDLLMLLIGSFAAGLVTLVSTQLVTAVLAAIAMGEATGRPLPDAAVWREMRRTGPRSVLLGAILALASALLVALPLGIGVLLAVVAPGSPGVTIAVLLIGTGIGLLLAVWLWARTVLAVPALVVEDLGPLAALRRSFELTRGRRLWRVLGIALLLVLATYVVSQVVGSVVGVVAMGGYLAILLATGGAQMVLAGIVMLVVTMIGACVSTVLSQPFTAAGTTALYADQRMRVEAWDLDLEREAREARESGAAAAGTA
ncbi:glycerophosphoryl diester phosphodiesterase membrane domain-containing protein [Brachybacterium huguangmaarense]